MKIKIFLIGLVLTHSFGDAELEKGFRPFFVGTTWVYEFQADSTRWTKEVSVQYDTIILQKHAVILKAVEVRDSTKSIHFDTIVEGYIQPRNEYNQSLCDLVSIYPDSGIWDSKISKNIIVDGSEYSIQHTNECYWASMSGPAWAISKRYTYYADSNLGIILKEGKQVSGVYGTFNLKIELKSMNGIPINVSDLIEAFSAVSIQNRRTKSAPSNIYKKLIGLGVFGYRRGLHFVNGREISGN